MSAEPLAVSPSRAAELLGVSRPTLYALIDKGAVRSVKCGNRRLVSVASLRSFVDGECNPEMAAQ